MADFDNNFAGENPPEDDPAAEFLAREQNELAGLEDDNFGGDAEPQQEGGNFDAFGGSDSGAPQEDDFDHVNDLDEFANDLIGGGLGGGFDMLGGESSDDGLLDMGSAAPSDGLVDMGGPAPTLGDGLLDSGLPEPSAAPPPVEQSSFTNGPTDAYAAISQVDTQRAEPEKIRIWREEQKERLTKKDAEEEEKKLEWREVAKKELEDWYKHHAEQFEKTKENNRAGEAAFIKERDESIPGAQWEKICRLCEFNPKNMKSTKDVSRMRSMLLQLKQTPLVR